MAAPSRIAARQARAAESLNEQTEELAQRVTKLEKALEDANAKLDLLVAALVPDEGGGNKNRSSKGATK